MASMTSHPEQTALKPSFAKVAASSYGSPHSKENHADALATPPIQTTSHPQIVKSTPFTDVASKAQNGVHIDRRRTILARAEDASIEHGQWTVRNDQSPLVPPQTQRSDSGVRSSNSILRHSTVDDSSTQLSSSDDSAKPPSLDGKSVASGTTFALDEKESLRPDDSASLRAIEEDGASPPGSTAPDSPSGSDDGAARAFSEQLREIATMDPPALRGPPPGRIAPVSVQLSNAVYSAHQPATAGPTVPAQAGSGINVNIGTQGTPLPDEKLLDALESQRDRVWVLKLEQDLIDFVKDPKESQLILPNCNAFYRMLAHKLADYYILAHMVDESLTAVKISKTEYCHIPPPLSGFSSTSGAAVNTPPIELPARKIMRRGEDSKPASGTNTTTNSEAPSKAASESDGANGSESGQGPGSDPKSKNALSHESRMAKYQEARQRIFGGSDGTDGAETRTGEEDNDNSRSSSTSGKKPKKKQRNYDDEDFESRAQYNAYPPSVFTSNGYPVESAGMMYGQYGSAAIGQQQYQMMPTHIPPQMAYHNAYSMPQEVPQQFHWQGQPYQAAPHLGYGMQPQPMSYDLSQDFQRGMQSFQTAPNLTPQMPKVSPAMNGPFIDYRQQTQPANQNWPQMQPQPGYPQPSMAYAQGNGSPVPSPQSMYQSSYPYGQLPAPILPNGKQNRNQHPLPGSYNRNQFNPQIQAFVPGGRGASFSMQGPHPQQQMTPPAVHSYPNVAFAMPVQNQVPRPSPPHSQPSTYSSPHTSNNSPSVAKNGSSSRSFALPHTVSSTLPQPPNVSTPQSSTSSIPAQSSISKWSTTHLPPKPPPPATMQPPKYTLPGQNLPAAARLPAPAVASGRPN